MILVSTAVLVILPLLVSAIPHDARAPAGAGPGGRIGISKHSSLTNKDGSLDPRILRNHIIRAEDKLRQGVTTMQQHKNGLSSSVQASPDRLVFCARNEHLSDAPLNPATVTGQHHPTPSTTGQASCRGVVYEYLARRDYGKDDGHDRGDHHPSRRKPRESRSAQPLSSSVTVSNTNSNPSATTSGGTGKPSGAPGLDALETTNFAMWFGKVSVGTPPVEYTINFDTGSSDFFIPGSACNLNCEGHTLYNPKLSSTSGATDRGFIIGFADGTMAAGNLFAETASIAGFAASNQTVGSVMQYSPGFAVDIYPADGLMGLGFDTLSTFGSPNLIQALASQGALPEPVFAFKLASSGSELSVGGVNQELFKGNITFAPVTEKGFWQIDMNAISVNGQQALDSIPAIIDSGTTLIVGDFSEVAQLYKSIPGAQDASATVGQGAFTFPCDSVPNVSLTFGGKAFDISPDLFNIGTLDGQNCVGGIIGGNVGSVGWVVGDIFMQNVYSVFDIGNTQVGFAELA